jgi:hypothetical protein
MGEIGRPSPDAAEERQKPGGGKEPKAPWWKVDFGQTGTVPFIIAGSLGVVGLGIYASQAPNGWTVFAAGLMFALSAGAVGGFVGFLFGVPRTVSSESTPPTIEGKPSFAAITGVVRPSTNLEQISDWLTKILVGATLVQLGTIGSGAARLFRAVAPALGDKPHSTAFAGALFIYFSLLGFPFGWLRARLLLGQLMRRADESMAYFAQAAVAEEAGSLDKAETLYSAGAMAADAAGDRQFAQQLRDRAGVLATRQGDRSASQADGSGEAAGG